MLPMRATRPSEICDKVRRCTRWHYVRHVRTAKLSEGLAELSLQAIRPSPPWVCPSGN